MSDLRSISAILTNYESYFVVQEYHRSYSWQSRQVIQLLRDMDNIILEKEDSYLYLSTIYYIKRESGLETYYELVDGYQRLATIMLILREIINIVRIEDPKNSNFEKFEMGLFDIENKRRLRLTPYYYYDSNSFFFNYITKGKLNIKLSQRPESLSTELNLINAITLIKNFLSKRKIEFWKGFTSKLTERIKVSMIQLSPNDNAIDIYNSLNGKGMKLDNYS